MLKRSLAEPVGDFEVVVFDENDNAKRFGRFESEAEAKDWAVMNRDVLRLAECETWQVRRLARRPF